MERRNLMPHSVRTDNDRKETAAIELVKAQQAPASNFPSYRMNVCRMRTIKSMITQRITID